MGHDQLFKDLLSTFFFEFLEVFVPDVYRHVQHDWIDFLETETFSDLASGERARADLCAVLKSAAGERLFLLHLEHEAQPPRDFPRRMFKYYVRFHERHQRDVYPVALFSFATPRKRYGSCYRVKFPGLTPLQFRYRLIQLNRLDWRKFLRRPNPVAAALMSRMRIEPKDRFRVKSACLRMIGGLGLDNARSHFLAAFVDRYLPLSGEEKVLLRREIDSMPGKERDVVLKLTTSWEQDGIEKGLQQGLEQGLEQGRESGLFQAVTQLVQLRFQDEGQNLLDRLREAHDAALLSRVIDALGRQASLNEVRELLG